MTPDALGSSRRWLELGKEVGERARPARVSSPRLAALRLAGTHHVYADTADAVELAGVVPRHRDATLEEVDGNTVNQPLVGQVLSRLLEDDDPVGRAAEVLRPELAAPRDRLPWIYVLLCARIGNEMTRAFQGDGPWEVSLQLPMAVGASYAESMAAGRMLHQMVPNALVKVPFTPDHPHCLLVARDLERAGIAVNVTSTFSARQVAAAALVCRTTRTNVFLGRIEQGLEGELLGEHVVREAQRTLRDLRAGDGVPTELIAASMRDWRTFVRLAGCDAFTAPCKVLRAFLEQDEVAPEDLHHRIEAPDHFRVSPHVLEKLGHEKIARLYQVEPEFLEFLRRLHRSPGFEKMTGGAELLERFDRAGFQDLFHAPSGAEREEARAAKLPDLGGALVRRIPLDTHYSILANEDFRKHQDEIDAQILRRVEGGA